MTEGILRRRRFTAALVVPLLLAIFVALQIPGAGAAPVAAAGSKVYVKDFKHKPRIKPERLYFAVGAGTILRFKDLEVWKHWNAPTTRVEGKFKYNTCKPDCASANYDTTGVKLELSRIRECKGQRRYTKVFINPKKDNLVNGSFRVDCRGYQDY